MFENRPHAGGLLAQKLQDHIDVRRAVVLGIPRGGVPVAKVIADKLNKELDVVVTKKLRAPYQKELAIGAIAVDGTTVLDRDLINRLGIKKSYLEKEKKERLNKLKEYERKFQKEVNFELKDKVVILVDDGIATGATIKVAVKYLRKQNVDKIVLAVPVAPKESSEKFKELVDELIILETPPSFRAVGQFYREFGQVEDKEVAKLLK